MTKHMQWLLSGPGPISQDSRQRDKIKDIYKVTQKHRKCLLEQTVHFISQSKNQGPLNDAR